MLSPEQRAREGGLSRGEQSLERSARGIFLRQSRHPEGPRILLFGSIETQAAASGAGLRKAPRVRSTTTRPGPVLAKALSASGLVWPITTASAWPTSSSTL